MRALVSAPRSVRECLDLRPLAVASLIVMTAIAGCSERKANGEAQRQRPAVPVTVAAVTRKPIPLEIRAIGNVEAYANVTVKTMVNGELMRVHFREGQDVKKGDLLYTIDPRPFEAALAQAQANVEKDRGQVAQARANLEKDVARVAQAKAVLARDVAQAKNAEATEVRWRELWKRELVAREQYEQIKTAAESSAASVRADEADVASAEQAVRSDQAAITSAEQSVRADEAMVQNARLQLAYTEIRSPLDGRTGTLTLNQGNVLKANDSTLVTINQVQPIYVTFSVPERELDAVKRYMAAGKVQADAIVNGDVAHPVRGAISFVDNAVDRATGTIKLKASFANEERRLWPGQFVDVVVTLTTEPDAVVVQSRAIQTGQQGQYVFVVKADGTVEVRPVVARRTQGDETVVGQGLQPGETVVTDGQLRLVPGARVEVKRT
jgi:membrane fusion protein, multidrug efflux system